MFYSVQIVSKGGPLQVIWLAAHMDRQLKRQQISDTSIPFSVDTIMKGSPGKEAPLALRLSGQLLLGIVKVYARKVAYLVQDCDDALHKMGALMHVLPDDSDAAGAPGRMASPPARHPHPHGKHGKHGAAGPSGGPAAGRDAEDAAAAGHWPGIEEDVFSSQPSQQLQLGTRSSDGSGCLPALSLRPSDSAATPRTPAVTHRMASSAGGGAVLGGGRALSYATSMPHPMDLDDEMFEAVPEHFQFDLEDFEVDELTAPAAALPSSQQMSTLQLHPTQPVEAAASEVEEALDGSGGKPRTPPADMEQDQFEFEAEPAAPDSGDQQATLRYESEEAGGEEGADAVPPPPAPDAAEGDDVPGPSSPASRPSRTKLAAAVAAAAGAGAAPSKAGAEPTVTRTPPRKKPLPAAAAAAAAAPAAVATPAKQEGRSKPGAAPAPAPAPQRPRLPLSHSKPVIDACGTTLANAEYRANLMDRSLFLRKKRGSGRSAAAGKKLDSRSAGILAAAASGQLLPLLETRQASLHLLYRLPAWSHPDLRALYASAFGIGPHAPGAPEARQPAAPAGAEEHVGVEQPGPMLPSPADLEEAGDGEQQEGSGLQRQPSGTSGSMLAPDLYRDEVLDVFEESRRSPDAESEEEGGLGWGGERGTCEVDAGVSDAGLTPRTEALRRRLQRLEQTSQRQQQGPGKRPRLEEGEAAAPELEPGAAAEEGVVRLSQLLPQEEAAGGGPRSRAAAAAGRAAPPPLLLRQAAAQTFYDLLVLQNRGLVQLEQSRAYEELRVVQRAR